MHQNPHLSPAYTCENCQSVVTAPKHCGRAMITQKIDDVVTWVCWKGVHAPCCGRESSAQYVPCCENPVLISSLPELTS